MHLKFLSKGLFFYYLLNFQNILKLWEKEKETHEKFSAIIPSCFVCIKVVFWLRSSSSYLTDTIPLPHSTQKKKKKRENEEIFLSDLFTYIFFRTSCHGNTSWFAKQYSFSVWQRWGGAVQDAFREILCFFLTHFHFPYSSFLRFLRNLILQCQPFS